ncbi:MAG: DUF2341 domain-containing protein [Candidatus Aenigmatarchaeota archaeon]
MLKKGNYKKFFLLFIIFFLSLIFIPKPSYAWLSGWQYRRNITISNTQNSNALTDYQVAINLTYDSDMQPDFSDIRFTFYNSTSGTETEISYWIEDKVDSSWAYVWVKVPYIPASSYATIYVYYGNTTVVSSASSLANTWENPRLFSTMNYWNGTVGYITEYVAGNNWTKGNTDPIYFDLGRYQNATRFTRKQEYGVDPYIKTNIPFEYSQGITVAFWYYYNSSGTRTGGGDALFDWRDSFLINFGGTSSRQLLVARWSGGNYAQINTVSLFPTDTWVYVVVVYNATTGTKVYWNGVEKSMSGSLSGTIDSTIAPLYVCTNSLANQYAGCEGMIDNYRIYNFANEVSTKIATNYVSSEPTYSIGVEEEVPNQPPTITIYSPLNQTYFKSYIQVSGRAIDDQNTIFYFAILLNGENSYLYENETYQNNTLINLTVSLPLGTHWVKFVANDGYGQTSQTIYFTIKDYEISQVSYQTNVYETSNQNFTIVLRYNPDLVQNITSKLIWNETGYGYNEYQAKNSTHIINTKQITIPLIMTNNTQIQFKFENKIKYNNFEYSENTTLYSQNILFAYWINSVSYSNYQTYNNVNYTKNLVGTATIKCMINDGNEKVLQLLVGNNVRNQTSFYCTGDTIVKSLMANEETDGSYNVFFSLALSDIVKRNSTIRSFYFDNTEPNVSITYVISYYFRNNITQSATFWANDITYATCNITLNYNSTTRNFKANSTVLTANLTDGRNVFNMKCVDLVGNENSLEKEENLFVKKFDLWEEWKNRLISNFTAFNSIKVKSENTNIIYDLKPTSTNSFFYVYNRSENYDRLRFEYSFYNTADTIVRFVDLDLIPTNTKVCILEEPTTYYSLYLLSSTIKKVGVLNAITDCIIGASRTEFLIQNSKSLIVYTTKQTYYLYNILSESQKVFLALLDGSIAQYINLDMLQYLQVQPSFKLLPSAISVSKIGNTTLQIFYKNMRNDNTFAIVRIFDGNEVILEINEEDNPNEISLTFDYSTVNLNNNILKIEIETNNGIDSLFFDVGGLVGIIPVHLAIPLAIAVFIFGSTISVRFMLGAMGLIFAIISIMILALTVQTPLVVFFEAVFIIISLFEILIIKEEYARVI